jgi:hypothetical protein
MPAKYLALEPVRKIEKLFSVFNKHNISSLTLPQDDQKRHSALLGHPYYFCIGNLMNNFPSKKHSGGRK